MNTMHTVSAGSSEIGDLDGYSLPGDYNYGIQSQYGGSAEEFGFDPPQNSAFPKTEQFSPSTLADPLQMSSWSGFDASRSKEPLLPHQVPSPSDMSVQSFEFDSMINQVLPNRATAIARFGQVTPPRSNSAASEDQAKNSDIASPTTGNTERRKRSSKSSIKEESESAAPASTGRKRKNTRKSSAVKEEQDDKRRQSLEKNRVAAAKCRINKKEKTEQLQRHSHEKAVHNAFLKEQVMRMKEEVQQMNAFLLAHANCEGCKSPEEIQKHLSNLGNEFFAHHMSSMNYEYPPINMDEMPSLGQDSAMQADYFGTGNGTPMLNPPLPDFDRNGDFEVHTPMQND